MTMPDLQLRSMIAPSTTTLLYGESLTDLSTFSTHDNFLQVEFVFGPQYDASAAINETVSGRDTPISVVVSKTVPSEELADSWGESFSDLDEVARGIDLEGPVPQEVTISTSKSLLRRLAATGIRAPLVDELPGDGVAISFPGPGSRTRLTFVIEEDGSIAYYELIDGQRWRGRFPTIASLLDIVWPSSFHRAGLLPRSL